VIVASGAWAGRLCPALAGALRASGQPVFHLRPGDAGLYRAERFPVFCDDIARTGYYGFPITRDGVVKVANHGPGTEVDMGRDERGVSEGEEAALREFLAEVLPELAGAEIALRRQCVYGDTKDGHFWIAEDPDRPGLVAATGGSGHGFKFAPVLGELIADVAEGAGLPAALAHRFRWRPELEGAGNQEAARYRGPPARTAQ
jgi:glycine/D-amino acid oxidase-like deaminating enzyme